MGSSLRNRLLLTFLLLVIVVGSGTLVAIERALARDLTASLDARLTHQGVSVASWLAVAGHPERLAPRLATVTGTRVTVIGADGLVQGDSLEPTMVGRPVGEAPEVSRARRGETGRAVRELRADEPPQYLVAVPADGGRVIRLAVPLGDVLGTRARMRNRLFVGALFGFLGCLMLSWIFVRAVTRPLHSMTLTAEKLARGDYDVPPPVDAGGELGLLARSMMHMAGEVKARVGELTDQRDLLSVVIGGLIEGVVVVDPHGAVLLVNDAARPLVGEGALPAPLRPLVDRALAGDAADAELPLAGRDVRVSARPLGAPGAIVVLSDVTRLRALEAVRREFLSNAAHELRTPVTSISGYAETLLAGSVDPDTSREFLGTIHRNAQRIADLVADLLVLDTLGGRATLIGKRGPVALAAVVGDAVDTARGVTPGAVIEIAIEGELAVLGTREGLEHVVQNLIDNALHHGAGTPVTVHATRAGAIVRMCVADRGPGIPPGLEERVFERFYRIDAGRSRAGGGSGLGLAIVRSQVEALGGRVWVEAGAPGARFVVELDAG